jgi:hypothetical protein
MNLNQEVFDIYKYFVIERNRIYKKRFIEFKDRPWTDDKILQDYRFTNIKRTQDRQTLNLLTNITNNNLISYRDKLFFSIIFRTWNKWESFKIIISENPTIDKYLSTSIQEYQSRINNYRSSNPDYKFFTDAFMVSGFLGSNRLDDHNNVIEDSVIRPIYLGNKIIKSGILNQLELCKNDKECYNNLVSISGLSKFLAYQIYIDLTYIKDSPFCEDNLVIAGPGCRAGIDYVSNDNNVDYEQFLKELWNNQDLLFQPYNLNDEFNYEYYYHGSKILSLEDLENSFCEFSKYFTLYSNRRKKIRKYKQ